MRHPESVLENETHKLLWDFDIQTDDQVMVNKKEKKENLPNGRLCRPADHRVKIKGNKKKGKYVDHARELKTMEYVSDADINYS